MAEHADLELAPPFGHADGFNWRVDGDARVVDDRPERAVEGIGRDPLRQCSYLLLVGDVHDDGFDVACSQGGGVLPSADSGEYEKAVGGKPLRRGLSDSCRSAGDDRELGWPSFS